MAFAAVGAVLAGTAGVATTLAAVAEVGAVVSVVGAVTGSKDMMKVGGMMSMVGGVGSLITGAADAATGAVADAAGSAAADNTSGIIGNAVQDAATNSAADYATMGYSASTNAAADALGGGMAQGVSGAVQGLGQDAPSLTSDMIHDSVNSQPDPMQQSMQNLQKVSGTPDVAGANSSITPQPQQAAATGDAASSTIADNTGSKIGSNVFMDKMDSLGQWMEKNKMLAGAITQVGGSILKSAFTPDYSQQMIDLKKQELAQNQQVINNKSTTYAGTRQPRVGNGGYTAPLIAGAMK